MWKPSAPPESAKTGLGFVFSPCLADYHSTFCFDVNSVSDFNSRKLDLAHKYVLWLDYASRAYGFPHHYLEELHDDVVEEVKCDDDFAGKIKEYVVIYLKIESPLLEVPGTYKLISGGSIKEEMSRTSDMIDVIQRSTEDLDRRLRENASYGGEMRSVKVTVQRLGDYFVVYAPLEKDIIRSMYALMILRNSWLFRLLGARGTFVRGAFTKGLGWEISSRNCKSTLYGPVIGPA